MLRRLPQKLLTLTSVIVLSLLILQTVDSWCTAIAQPQRRALTLRADTQQANAKTGVVTASGNVQLSYPARQIQATSRVAQYYNRERRIVLSGDVYVLQNGNSLRAETITYLIDEGRFIATPQDRKQVEATILVPDEDSPIIKN